MAENVPTIFLAQPNNYWILAFIQDVEAMTNRPHIFSISYGWSELEQCEIAVTNCATLGYNSMQYVNRTNIEFQKLGIMGVSVFVSDGDDGAMNDGTSTGNCPVDPNKYCPLGGCQFNSTQCPTVTLTYTNGTVCYFPVGAESPACSFFQNNTVSNVSV
jgi:hypothetical protein